MIDEMLPLHIKLIIFIAWISSFFILSKFLHHRYGLKKKNRYKWALCELYFGLSLIFFWKMLRQDWLTIGIPGIITTIHALGRLAYFAPKRIPDGEEKEDTTFR